MKNVRAVAAPSATDCRLTMSSTLAAANTALVFQTSVRFTSSVRAAIAIWSGCIRARIGRVNVMLIRNVLFIAVVHAKSARSTPPLIASPTARRRANDPRCRHRPRPRRLRGKRMSYSLVLALLCGGVFTFAIVRLILSGADDRLTHCPHCDGFIRGGRPIIDDTDRNYEPCSMIARIKRCGSSYDFKCPIKQAAAAADVAAAGRRRLWPWQ